MTQASIALIGYGEVGQALARDLASRGFDDLMTWDRLFIDPDSLPARAVGANRHARGATSMREALARRSVVISAVTAGDCLAAAREAATWIERDAWYLDLNSVAPDTKIEAAREVESAGGRYVEAAVMSPIAPKGSASPMLLGGRHAATFAAVAHELGFAGVEVYGDEIGGASAAKMCRSVMIKGVEALLTESLLTARHYGVEQSVLSSLQNVLSTADWPTLARYMISRSIQHGRRRAEEMREVARTVRDAGIDPWMSTACAERQDWAARHSAALDTGALTDLLDAVRALATPATGARA